MRDKLKLEEVILAYREAALKFVKKVDNGEARSAETYAELKAALKLDGVPGL